MPDCRVGELEQARSVEVDRFQRLLREEGERRETAERALEKLKGEVSIGMEDFSPSSSLRERRARTETWVCNEAVNLVNLHVKIIHHPFTNCS